MKVIVYLELDLEELHKSDFRDTEKILSETIAAIPGIAKVDSIATQESLSPIRYAYVDPFEEACGRSKYITTNSTLFFNNLKEISTKYPLGFTSKIEREVVFKPLLNEEQNARVKQLKEDTESTMNALQKQGFSLD